MSIELTAKMVVPTAITDAMLVSCTVAEPDAGETLWVAGTSYTVGTVVARATTHRLYENLIAGINATLPEVAALEAIPRWLEVAPTNRWAQFDSKIGTATTGTTDVTTAIEPGVAGALVLLDVVGLSAQVTVLDRAGGSVIYDRTVSMDDTSIESVYDWMFSAYVQKRNLILTDLPAQYPAMQISVTVSSTTGASIGVMAVGRVQTIGAALYGSGSGIINFGQVADDGFGNRTWIEGAWASRLTLQLIANSSDFNRIYRLLADNRSTPCIYIGSELDSLEPLVAYGVYRDLYITVPNYPSIAMNLEIDGLSNA